MQPTLSLSKTINWPNLLTALRVSSIPLFMLMFYLPEHRSYYALTAIFAAAALTDWLDGYLARRLHQISSFGAFLDPVADKLMVIVAMIAIVHVYQHNALSIMVAINISREVMISALREWYSQQQHKHLSVAWYGKLKTALQMAAIILLLLSLQLPILSKLALITMGLATLAALVSMGHYIAKLLPLR